MLKYDVKGKTCMVHILWQRLLGKKVVFITSTDNHGEKIATTAAVPMVIYIYIYIYIHEGFYCVYCEEYQEIFALDVATLSKFNFPYLLIVFILTYILLD